MSEKRRDIELILDPAFVADLATISTYDLRSRIARASDQEDDLSYQRRLLHAQQDLIKAELARRDGGEGHNGDLVGELRKTLSDAAAPGSRGARGRLGKSGTSPGRRPAEVLASDGFLARLHEASDQELKDRAAVLEREERPVSEQRRALHGVIDALQGELVARYKRGEADPLDVLRKTAQAGGT